jgi:hypothetical protein
MYVRPNENEETFTISANDEPFQRVLTGILLLSSRAGVEQVWSSGQAFL